MKLLTYTSCKEHFELFKEIHCPIAANSCQLKERLRCRYKINSTAGTYSIDD